MSTREYSVVLKKLGDDTQRIVLGGAQSKANAMDLKRIWRNSLGGKKWDVERRPGVDTLNGILALVIEER